jgi:integrase
MRGSAYYIRYADKHGHRKEEAAGTNEKAALKLLQQRIGEAASGAMPQGLKHKAGGDITIGDCLRLAVRDLERRRKPSAKLYEYQIDTAFASIEKKKASLFTYDQAWKFIEARRKEGCKESTINRDLSQLRSALKLASEEPHKLIASVPKIPQLDPGDNVRTGFLTPAQYSTLMSCLPDYLKPLTCFAYFTGLRKRTLCGLRLNQVDLTERLVWVSRKQTKNRHDHTVPILDGEMLRYCLEALQKNKVWLFEQQNGRPFNDFRRAWVAAVTLAGMPELRFHDLRRTAVKDWIATGAPESSVMAISGHKTHTMLRRYNIINAAVVQQAARLRNSLKNGEENGADAVVLPS